MAGGLRREQGWVEVAGIEPASFVGDQGLLRAQSAVLFSAPAVTRTSCRRAQSLLDVLLHPVTGFAVSPLTDARNRSGNAPGLTDFRLA